MKRKYFFVIFFLALSIFLVGCSGVTPPPINLVQSPTENEYFIIKYQSGYEEDASKTLDSAMWVRGEHTMKKYLHDLGVKVTIYMYNSREEIMAEEGVPTGISHTGYDGQNYTASIGILRPSWEGHWGGYEELDNPFRGLLNHEYVHSVFCKDLFMKSTGYKDPPSWFTEGIAEYISENYCPSYEKRVREAVQSGSFMIDEPYSWGLYILEYMYKEYGQVKIISLIRSTAPTFLDALKKELGVSPSEFEDGWQAYLTEKFVN